MRNVGRKLVLDWEDGKVVVIEILVKGQGLYSPKPSKPLLFDIYEALGERIERAVGPCADGRLSYGQDMNGLMPVMSPECWLTEEEYERLYPKRTE